MNEAHRTRTMLEPKEDSEFKKEIEEAFARYDKISKPRQLDEYGFYDGTYNNMKLDDIYSKMQIDFELRELDNKYYRCRDLRNIADTVIKSIDEVEKYQIDLQPEAKKELQRIFENDDADLRYQDEIQGALILQVDKAIDLIYLKYLKALIHYEGIQRVKEYMFPRERI